MLAAAEQISPESARRCMRSLCPCTGNGFRITRTTADLSGDALQNKVITEVIDRINQDHVQPGELLQKVKAEAAGIRAFIVQKDLLTLSDRDNLRIVPTPVFFAVFIPLLGFIPRRRSSQRRKRSTGSPLSIPR